MLRILNVSGTVVFLVRTYQIIVVSVVGEACQALEDDAAAHRDYLRSTPFARLFSVRDWEEGKRGHDIECCKHWDDVSIMDAITWAPN